MSYNAIVCPLQNVEKHPDADRLQIATAMGHTVIIGLNQVNGDLGLFFPPDGQLSLEFATANDLLKRVDKKGKQCGGFFESSRRVRNIALRGVKTEGFWISVESLAKLHEQEKGIPLVAGITVGLELDSYQGIPLCNKYITPATIKARSESSIYATNNKTKRQVKELHGLAMHWNTPQLKQSTHSFQKVPGAIIITEKLHGTSGRLGCAKVSRPKTFAEMTLLEKVSHYVFRRTPAQKKEWKVTNGTRNVVLLNDHQKDKYRFDVVKGIEDSLHHGETIFFEIVGYTHTGAPIMPAHDLRMLKNKILLAKYGEHMEYRYGCSVEEDSEKPLNRLFVYRISRTSDDGHELDMPWNQLTARCAELGLDHVPVVMANTQLSNIHDFFNPCPLNLESLSSGGSVLDSHLKEGICIRVEYFHETKPKIFKLKNWEFGVLEGYIKDDADYIDEEESN